MNYCRKDDFFSLPIFQSECVFGMLSRKMSCRACASLGHLVKRCMNISGSSSHNLHSGAIGWPILFWCFDRKLCPVIARLISCIYAREYFNRVLEWFVWAVGKKNFVCTYWGSSVHLIFHSSLISFSTVLLVWHHGFAMYLVKLG